MIKKEYTRIKLTEDKKQNDALMKIQKGESLTEEEKEVLNELQNNDEQVKAYNENILLCEWCLNPCNKLYYNNSLTGVTENLNVCKNCYDGDDKKQIIKELEGGA